MSESFEEWFGATFGSYLNDETPLSIASRALHGQPFGFTREDVRALDWRIEQAVYPSEADELRRIRDRIEALLPPEAKEIP
jgi:hypothetical protein